MISLVPDILSRSVAVLRYTKARYILYAFDLLFLDQISEDRLSLLVIPVLHWLLSIWSLRGADILPLNLIPLHVWRHNHPVVQSSYLYRLLNSIQHFYHCSHYIHSYPCPRLSSTGILLWEPCINADPIRSFQPSPVVNIWPRLVSLVVSVIRFQSYINQDFLNTINDFSSFLRLLIGFVDLSAGYSSCHRK